MTHRPLRSRLGAAMLGALGCTTLMWSGAAQACAAEPYISSVCIMALNWSGMNGFLPANGATLNVSQYQALFSLIGFTYGGNNSTQFNLPDLRGRVVIGMGAGPGLPVYNAGDKGGAATVMLTNSMVPVVPHVHGVSGVTVNTTLGSLNANTVLSGLTATTSLSGVTATAAGSGLTLQGYSGAASTGSPGGAALASGGLTRIYATSAPNVAMMANSIAGNAPVSFSGSPTTTITGGTATTTLTGVPSSTLAGTSDPAAAPPSAAVPIMPPYIALNYFIAANGLYPSRP